MNQHLKLKNRLKEVRKSKNLKQGDLAKMVNSTINTISAIETGIFCPTAYLAALLCAALESKFEDLFYLDLDSKEEQ